MKHLALIVLLLLSTLTFAKDAPKWGIIVNAPADLSINGDGAEGGALPQVFIPIQIKEDSKGIVFVDLRSYFKNTGSGANISLGYRHQINKKTIVGGYTALYNHSNYENYFSQIAAGVEIFTEYIDASINFYAPITGDKEVSNTSYLYAQLNNDNFELIKKDSDLMGVMPGMDINVSVDLPTIWNIELAAKFSVYNYWGGEKYDSIWGASVAVEATKAVDLFGLDSEFFFSMGYDYNSATGSGFQASAGVKIALGKKGNTKDDLYKSPTMASSPTLGYYQSNPYTLDGYVTVNDNNYGGMTTLDANDDVVAAVAAAGNDSLVLLSGDAGTITVTEGVILNEGQSIIGEGQAFIVNGPNGEQAVLLVNSERATIQTATDSETGLFTGSSVFVMNNNTFLGSMNIDSSAVAGINGVSVGGTSEEYINGVTLYDLTISNTYKGISFSYANNVTIQDSTIENTGSDGIYGKYSNGVYIINDTFTATGGESIYLNQINDLLINNCKISGAQDDAIEVYDVTDGIISNCNFSQILYDAIDVNDSNNITIISNKISEANFGGGNGGTAIEISSTEGAWIEANTIDQTYDDDGDRNDTDIQIINSSSVTLKNNGTSNSEEKIDIYQYDSNVLIVSGNESIENIYNITSYTDPNLMSLNFESPVTLNLELSNAWYDLTGSNLPLTITLGSTECVVEHGSSALTCSEGVDPSSISGVTSISYSAATTFGYVVINYTIL